MQKRIVWKNSFFGRNVIKNVFFLFNFFFHFFLKFNLKRILKNKNNDFQKSCFGRKVPTKYHMDAQMVVNIIEFHEIVRKLKDERKKLEKQKSENFLKKSRKLKKNENIKKGSEIINFTKLKNIILENFSMKIQKICLRISN